MQTYVKKTKVHALPMTLGEYNRSCGWTARTNEDETKHGYALFSIENKPTFEKQWVSVEDFKNNYEAVDGMNFGDAVYFLKVQNCFLVRKSWKIGTFIFMTNNTSNECLFYNDYYGDLLKDCKASQIIYYKNEGGFIVPWNPDHSDLLSNDWSTIIPEAFKKLNLNNIEGNYDDNIK